MSCSQPGVLDRPPRLHDPPGGRGPIVVLRSGQRCLPVCKAEIANASVDDGERRSAMPREDFYQGLTLVERIGKFIDFHSDKKYRHISQYEAQMLDTAVARLQQTLDVATAEAREELEAVYEQLSQLYETVVYGGDLAMAVVSLRTRGIPDAAGELERSGLVQLALDPTPLQVQAAIAAF